MPLTEGLLCMLQSGFLDEFPFDPVGLNSEANQVKEIKNGRLAMVRTCPQQSSQPHLCLGSE